MIRLFFLGIAIGFFCFVSERFSQAQEDNSNREEGSNVEEKILVEADWSPLSFSKYNVAKKWKEVGSLAPMNDRKLYSLSKFDFFVPPTGMKNGVVWKIDSKKIVPILKQFHPGATASLHHYGPEGCFGCVIAENDEIQKVRFRLHAEFKLRNGFYTPSMFVGESLIRKTDRKVLAIKIHVPKNHYNVDLNWNTGRLISTKQISNFDSKQGRSIPEIVADIGSCESMSLVGGDWKTHEKVKWDVNFNVKEMDQLLKEKFYRFSKIRWVPWEIAVDQSKSTGKPLHVVAIFGVLDDESC